MTWTTEEDNRLINLITVEKKSYEDAARAMNRTKNSVSGRCHRLQKLGLLPVQENPAKAGPGGPKRPYKRRPKDATLPPLEEAPPAAPPSSLPPLEAAVQIPTAAAEPEPAAPIAMARVRTCIMPTWGNERPTHLYCGEPVARRFDGTPALYCPACYKKAYTPHTWRIAA